MNISDNNKKYNLAIISLIIAIVVLIVVFILVFFNIDNNNLKGNSFSSAKTKTIMVYMVGSDLESKYGAASADLFEMETANANLDNLNVLVYTGGANTWYNNEATNNSILKLTNNGFEVVKNDSVKNMGESSTLSYFIDYVTDNYDSDIYNLILWDHGGGPLVGYGYDEVKNDILELSELVEALDQTNFNSKNKLGFIGFDACLMASIEVANELKDYTNYLIASQETEPGAGWDYTFLKEINTDSSHEDIGKFIVDYYFNYYDTLGVTYDLTLSLLNLDKVDNVEKNLNNLFQKVNNDLTSLTFANFARKRVNTKTFGKYNSSSDYDLVDLNNMAVLLKESYPNDADQLIDSIEEFVIYNKSNIYDAAGISIYYPYSNRTYARFYSNKYKQFDFADNYTSYINNFTNILVGEQLKNLDISNKVPVSSSSDKYDFSLTLNDEQLANYSKAGYIVFRKLDTGYFEPIYQGFDVEVKGNTINANVKNKGIKVIGNNEETGWIQLNEVERTIDYTNYISPSMLLNISDSSDDFDIEMLSGRLQIRVDKNDNIEIMGFIPDETEGGVAPKQLTSLDDWQIVQFLKFSYNILDDNGNYKTDWDSSEVITGWELHVEDIKEFQRMSLDENEEYYCIFSILDSQGNQYYSNLVAIN